MRFNRFWCYRRILFSKKFISTLWLSRRNVVAGIRNLPPAAGPYMAELDITYRCDCRCRMCQRWKDTRGHELRLSEYRKLAEALKDLGAHQISIAGGEPLLRSDVFEIIASFSRYGMSVNLCTNGTLLHKYLDEICRSGATSVTVSLDGATAESHDSLRRADDSFRLIKNGLQALLRRPLSKRPLVRVRMTISSINIREIHSFYRTWEKVADDVLFQPIHACSDSYYTGLGEESYRLDPHELASQISGTPMANDAYMKRLITSLRETGGFPSQRCYAGILMVRIDPWGKVYPCLEQHVCVGSVRDKDFRMIWNSRDFNRVRQRLISQQRCSCWYNNTALIGHYGGILACSGWNGVGERVRGLLSRGWRSVCST